MQLLFLQGGLPQPDSFGLPAACCAVACIGFAGRQSYRVLVSRLRGTTEDHRPNERETLYIDESVWLLANHIMT